MDKRSIAYAKHISQQLNLQFKENQKILDRSVSDLAFLQHTLATLVKIYDARDSKKEKNHGSR